MAARERIGDLPTTPTPRAIARAGGLVVLAGLSGACSLPRVDDAPAVPPPSTTTAAVTEQPVPPENVVTPGRVGGETADAASGELDEQEQETRLVEDLMKAAFFALTDSRAQDALPLLRSALDLQPKNPRVHRSLGVVYEELGDREAARQSFETYLELAPGAVDAQRIRDKVRELR